MKKTGFSWVLGTLVAVLLSGCGGLDRLHQIDSDGAYSIYRSGQPDEDNVEEICELGVKKVFALNGEGRKYAEALRSKCPGAEVVYDLVQVPGISVGREFLEQFDAAVAEARAAGQGILFHCSCGCHRTGRLAAYYRMKYQGWTSDAAIEEMMEIGDDMDQHPYLPAQVKAMEEFIQGKPCTQPAEYCFSST